MTATFIGYSLIITPAGYLSDRIGRKIVIVGGMLISSFTSICIGLTDSFAFMTWLRFGTGLGLGTHIAASNALISDYFKGDGRQKAISFHESGSNVGFMLTFILVGFLSSVLNWSFIFVIVGFLGEW